MSFLNLKQKSNFVLLGFVVFLLFGFFSILVGKDIFNAFDFDLTVKLQNNISRGWDSLFSAFSLIGSFEIVLIILLIILLIARKVRAILVLFIFAVLHGIELYGKMFLEHLPPPHFMVRTEDLVELPQFYVRSVNSYPSGHSARTAFISVLAFLLINRTKKLSKNQKKVLLGFIILFDVTMFVSRVYLGEHWTTDVIGGGLLGASLGLLSLVLL